MRKRPSVSMHHMSGAVADGRKFKDYSRADEMKSLCLPLSFFMIIIILHFL